MAHEKLRSLRPTPSMAVAITALVFAASGGAYAAAGGPAAHASAVGHAKAAASKKKKKKPTTGPRGPRGPRGLRGFAGPAGHAGPAGATGATGAAGSAGAKGATGSQGIHGNQGQTGATGPAGPGRIFNWSQTGIVPPVSGGGGASGAGIVTLAIVGPFTIVGKCTTDGTNVYAQNYIRTSQNGSSLDDFGRAALQSGALADGGFNDNTQDPTSTVQTGGQNVLGDIQINKSADNLGGISAQLQGTLDSMTTAVSQDGLTYLNSFESAGVTGSGTNATCYFDGFLMSNGNVVIP